MRADPLIQAEEAFVAEINRMAGIELVGGPFRSGERSNFGETGFFVIAPATQISTLEQRLSVQTRFSDRTEQSLPNFPIAPSSYTAPADLSGSDRRSIHEALAKFGYGAKRDEVTLFADGSVQTRPVYHLPLIKLTQVDSNRCIALLGAQTWQGIPLYRASFDRIRGQFDLEILRENFVPKRSHELSQRPFPIYSPQTFFADPGLNRADWSKVLEKFARFDLPPVQIIDALGSDSVVTLRADVQLPVLPQSWVLLHREASQWKLRQAVDLRSEFPRPSPWWTFLPLLAETGFQDRYETSTATVPRTHRIAIGQIVQRLRGVGQISSFAALPKESIRVTTTHNGWRGYHLDFASIQNQWRLTGMTEWTE